MRLRPLSRTGRALRHALLNAAISDTCDPELASAMAKTAVILRAIERITNSGDTPAVKVRQIRGVLGIPDAKRGVAGDRDALLLELVALITVKGGLKRPTEFIFQQVAGFAGLEHHRTVEKIWAEADHSTLIADCTSFVRKEDGRLEPDAMMIAEQIESIKSLLSA